MKIATFNINNVNRRLPHLLSWLKASRPDVVCLQELKSTDADFPAGVIEKAGYHSIWRGQKTWNGRHPLTEGKADPHARRPPRRSRRCANIEAAVNGILIGCIYLPNGNPQPGPKFQYKLAWFKRLASHAKRLLAQGVPTALAGDFNVAPTPQDIYPTRSWDNDALVQPESRHSYAALLKQGWTDAIRTLHPDEPMYTFWHYMRNRWPRDAGLRLDHLLLSPPLASRLVDAGVDRDFRGREGASDHAPAWVTLSDGKRRVGSKSRSVPRGRRLSTPSG
jgi:exodeoxyribonuclease III